MNFALIALAVCSLLGTNTSGSSTNLSKGNTKPPLVNRFSSRKPSIGLASSQQNPSKSVAPNSSVSTGVNQKYHPESIHLNNSHPFLHLLREVVKIAAGDMLSDVPLFQSDIPYYYYLVHQRILKNSRSMLCVMKQAIHEFFQQAFPLTNCSAIKEASSLSDLQVAVLNIETTILNIKIQAKSQFDFLRSMAHLLLQGREIRFLMKRRNLITIPKISHQSQKIAQSKDEQAVGEIDDSDNVESETVEPEEREREGGEIEDTEDGELEAVKTKLIEREGGDKQIDTADFFPTLREPIPEPEYYQSQICDCSPTPAFSIQTPSVTPIQVPFVPQNQQARQNMIPGQRLGFPGSITQLPSIQPNTFSSVSPSLEEVKSALNVLARHPGISIFVGTPQLAASQNSTLAAPASLTEYSPVSQVVPPSFGRSGIHQNVNVSKNSVEDSKETSSTKIQYNFPNQRPVFSDHFKQLIRSSLDFSAQYEKYSMEPKNRNDIVVSTLSSKKSKPWAVKRLLVSKQIFGADMDGLGPINYIFSCLSRIIKAEGSGTCAYPYKHKATTELEKVLKNILFWIMEEKVVLDIKTLHPFLLHFFLAYYRYADADKRLILTQPDHQPSRSKPITDVQVPNFPAQISPNSNDAQPQISFPLTVSFATPIFPAQEIPFSNFRIPYGQESNILPPLRKPQVQIQQSTFSPMPSRNLAAVSAAYLPPGEPEDMPDLNVMLSMPLSAPILEGPVNGNDAVPHQLASPYEPALNSRKRSMDGDEAGNSEPSKRFAEAGVCGFPTPKRAESISS